MAYENNHYVPKFLIKRWAGPNQKVCYFDFHTKKFERDTPTNLLAQQNVFPAKLESFLNKKIETPFSDFVHQFDTMYAGKPISNWRIFRSLILYFITQPGRFALANDHGVTNLAELTTRDDEYLNNLVKAFMESHNLIVLTCSPGHSILLPSCGFFAFPVINRDNAQGFGNAYATPMDSGKALIMMPIDVPENVINQQRDVLMAHSVCPGEHLKHVILPYHEEYFGDDSAKYSQKLLDFREQSVTSFRLEHEKQKIIQEMNEKILEYFGM